MDKIILGGIKGRAERKVVCQTGFEDTFIHSRNTHAHAKMPAVSKGIPSDMYSPGKLSQEMCPPPEIPDGVEDGSQVNGPRPDASQEQSYSVGSAGTTAQ